MAIIAAPVNPAEQFQDNNYAIAAEFGFQQGYFVVFEKINRKREIIYSFQFHKITDLD